MNALIGQKTEQLQRFLEDGRRVPITVLRVPETSVVQLKTPDTDGYAAVQLGIGMKNASKITKSLAGHVKKSGAKAPLFLQEIRLTADETLPEVGTTLKAVEILEPGDIVWVTGTSKGKGFAGGVKRYGFRGGPRTHGQSDRERAPGSIGQTTTPGRVYRGKRMAGNMGNDQVTIKNLLVVSVNEAENSVMVAGLVPGLIGSYVKVVKMGTKKKFTPLLPNALEQAKIDEENAKAEAEAAKAAAEAEKIAAEEAAKAEAEAKEAPVAEAAPATEEVAEETAAEATSAPIEEAPAAIQAEEAETDTTPVAEEAKTEETAETETVDKEETK